MQETGWVLTPHGPQDEACKRDGHCLGTFRALCEVESLQLSPREVPEVTEFLLLLSGHQSLLVPVTGDIHYLRVK